MASHIKDSNLWESGELKLSWVRRLGSRRLPVAPDEVEAAMAR